MIVPVNYDTRDGKDNDEGEGGDGDKTDDMDDIIIGDNAADDGMVTAVSFVVTQLLQERRRRRRRNQHEVRRWRTGVAEIVFHLLHLSRLLHVTSSLVENLSVAAPRTEDDGLLD